mgnify:FL=1
MVSLDWDWMADSPYLVALALIDQGGRRALPLAGKSQALVADEGDAPDQLGKELALDLLLRVWQRSDDGPLQRAAAADSLLLVELPMERLPEDLPQIKADWLSSGATTACLEAMKRICSRAWRLSSE